MRILLPVILFMVGCSGTPEEAIVQRWKMADVTGTNERFRQTQLARQMEMEFTKDSRCLIYEEGVMKHTVQYTMAPDGKSMVFNIPGTAEQASMAIVSLDDKQLAVTSRVFGSLDTLVFRPR
jgi:hypothetical protein